MEFNPNKASVEIIKEGAFGGKTYFRDIYSGVNRKWYWNWKWYRNSWKELNELNLLIKNIIFPNITILNWIDTKLKL